VPSYGPCRGALTSQCVAAGHVVVTGGEHWRGLDQTARRLFLIRHGVRVYASRDDDGLAVVSEGGGLYEKLEALTGKGYLAEMAAKASRFQPAYPHTAAWHRGDRASATERGQGRVSALAGSGRPARTPRQQRHQR